MNNEIQILNLHKYFIRANRMRDLFDKLCKEYNSEKINKQRFDIETEIYMALWYGLLYVVIEGWERLNLKDEKIDKLLKSNNVKLLKNYRNGIFHFQKEYYSEKHIRFITEGNNSVSWVRELNSQFGHFF